MNPTDDDQKVLEALAASGSDLTREHSIDFFLYFRTELETIKADDVIRANWPFLVPKIERAAGSDEWVLTYKTRLVPELEILRAIRKTFVASGGDYDGWGADIERQS